MKTSPSNRCLFPRRVSRWFITALLVSCPLAVQATLPSRADLPTNTSTAVPADPYLEYLAAIGARHAECQPIVDSLTALLKEQEQLALSFVRASQAEKPGICARIDAVVRRIHEAEVELSDALALVRATELPPPPEVPKTPFLDWRKREVREAARRALRPRPPELPAPLPVTPYSAREAAYLDYLHTRAADSPMVKSFLAAIEKRIHQRHDLSLRYLTAVENERPALVVAVEAVSYSIRASEAGLFEVCPSAGATAAK